MYSFTESPNKSSPNMVEMLGASQAVLKTPVGLASEPSRPSQGNDRIRQLFSFLLWAVTIASLD